MNWVKENPFLTGLIVVAAALLGGLSYFAYSNYTQYAELQATYAAEVQKLQGLQNGSPFPSQENLQKIKESTRAYQNTLNELTKALAAYQMPLDKEVTPQQFQDKLRKAVSHTQAKATEAGVKLPLDFYLGFDAYRAGLPSQEATPALARQLQAIEAIVNGLIETRIAEITQFSRSAVTSEGGSGPTKPKGPASSTAPVPPKVVKNLLDVTFSGEQGRIRLAVNSLLSSPQFLIIRALEIQNSATFGPAKTRKEGSEEGGNKSTPTFNNKSSGALNMLFGRETLAVKMRLELLDFENLTPEPPRKAN